MNDEKILDLYFKRDEAAITATATTYGKYCHTIAYNILYNQEDAEECVNDTYLGAWNAIPPHRPSRLAAFLGKITRNLSINRYNKYNAKKRGQGQMEIALAELNDCIPDHNNVEKVCEMAELERTINTFLRNQPEDKRNIFIRRYWFLYSISEISKAYDMNENKVTTILFRMRNELKTHLEKEGITL